MPDDAPKKHRRQRPDLTADRIAAEAMALVDEAGLDALSFRALGKRLGCEAMSLYHYYPSKAHLIDALVNICIAEIEMPPEDLSVRERLRRFSLSYRATVLRHPAFAPIFTTHRLNHREGLALLENFVRILDTDRITTERKATFFRVLSYFVTGAVIDEALGYAAGPSAADPVPTDIARAEFPGVMAMGEFFGKDRHLFYFETGLDLILDWIGKEL